MKAVLIFLVSVVSVCAEPSSALLTAMAAVESSGRHHIVNQREQAYGTFQIRASALRDINAKHRTRYQLRDFLGNPQLGAWAVEAYGDIYRAKTDEQYARIWNGGPSGPRKQATLKYWQKVKRNMR